MTVTAPPATGRRTLGTAHGAAVEIAVTSTPWELDLDALVVSTGAATLGLLGTAAFAHLGMAVPALRSVTPDRPLILDVPARGADRPALRHVLVATPHDTARGSRGDATASLDAVARSTGAAVRLAARHHLHALGLPLLGAGVVGLAAADVAVAELPAALTALRRLPAGPRWLVFIVRDEVSARAVEHAWSYHELFSAARDEAVRDDAVVAQADRIGMPEAERRRLVDVDDDELWRSCGSELAPLRALDAEAEELRAQLVQMLELDRSALQSGAGPAAPGLPGTKGRDQRLLADLSTEIGARLDASPRWRDLQVRRAVTEDQARQAVVRNALLPLLRAEINRRTRKAVDRSRDGLRAHDRRPLPPADTRGLRRPPELTEIVHTDAHRDLLAVLAAASAETRASLGVAGPRGCGKSTLLTMATHEWTGGGLVIEAPAPTGYAPREFLLWLYGKVCQDVIRRDPSAPAEPLAPPPRAAHVRAAGLAGMVLAPLLVLVTGVVVLATAAPGVAAAHRPGTTGAVLLAGAVAALAVLLVQRHAERAAAAGADGLLLARKRLGWRLPGPVRVLLAAAACGAVALLAGAGVLAAPAAAGTALLVAALGTSVLLHSARRAGRWLLGRPPQDDESLADTDRLALLAAAGRDASTVAGVATAQLGAALCGAALLLVPGAAALTVPLVAGGLLAAAGSAAAATGVRWHRLVAAEARTSAAPPLDEHSRTAARALARLRYQTSVVSGWTTTAKLAAGPWLPVAAEAALTGSTTEAELPLGVPDIVEGIKHLLPARGPALVTIDELDKIESPEEARAFLNEIKGILDARGVCFLLSMSEDAIARFERRGLPFRDVFDSAFDEILRAPLLDHHQALSMLDKRVIDVPLPFLSLAYCQSGGLPRDLLRAADRMLAPAGGTGPAAGAGAARDLAAVAREVVHRDLAGKITAISSAIRPIVVEPDVSEVLRCLRDLDTCDGAGLRGAGPCFRDPHWLQPFDRLPPLLGADAQDLPQRRELSRLTVELLGYFYYCRTLLELFDVGTDAAADRLGAALRATGGGCLDQLARVRQTFGVNPYVAWRQLTELRSSPAVNLLPFPLPGSLLPAAAPPPGRRAGPAAGQPPAAAARG
ncbi:hypothetical protein [Spirilliplanes yamanashiensis]|uniref:Uncharacterized protein n=1 Tax=Spirilliplanes yamanashiensis TaxID=42233 RepID=A0A8J3YB06_9ACTN|nr:hypothetical protein [Spirilliplanes yamanashiensis]MDP9817638.1 hypothetical protein [Spirilliplanes yamanashiensis]GIJ04448.1 hypothetical protein Sya03_38000 [Spirilliplanes yamanashiensis]